MSCLTKKHRLNQQKEFNKLYKSGKKWHTHSFVAFFSPNENLKVAFVASKKVGNAVIRNKAKRRLRAIFLENESKIKNGSYIFVAKNDITTIDYKTIKKNFNFAFKRLELYL